MPLQAKFNKHLITFFFSPYLLRYQRLKRGFRSSQMENPQNKKTFIITLREVYSTAVQR